MSITKETLKAKNAFGMHFEIDNVISLEDSLKASKISGAQEYLVKETLNQSFLIQIIRSSIYRKQVENNLYQKAHYDSLTHLPNKSFFFRRCKKHAGKSRTKESERSTAFYRS